MLNLDNFILGRVRTYVHKYLRIVYNVLHGRYKLMGARYKAIDIARWFIMRNQLAVADAGGEPMSLLKLLKLLYYAEGSSLALGKGSLFDDPMVAWEHGPVVESIWRKYNKDPYNLPFGSDDDYESLKKISKEDDGLLESVFNVFGKYSAWGLRDMTHREEPWIKATNNGRVFNRRVNRDVMKKYFKNHYVKSTD